MRSIAHGEENNCNATRIVLSSNLVIIHEKYTVLWSFSGH